MQTVPHLYVVFWGPSWSSTAGDPNAIQGPFKTLFGAIGGHSWINSVTQYTQSNGQHAGYAANIFMGSYVDATSSPLPQDSDIAAEAVKAGAHFRDYSPSAAYVVALPHNVIPIGFRAQYCAWHSSTAAAGSTIAYTNLPYMPDAGILVRSGQRQHPGHDRRRLDRRGPRAGRNRERSVPEHRLDRRERAENGDKCVWTGLQNNPNAGGFPTASTPANNVFGVGPGRGDVLAVAGFGRRYGRRYAAENFRRDGPLMRKKSPRAATFNPP